MNGMMIVMALAGALVMLFVIVGQPLLSLLSVPRQLNHLLHGILVRRNQAIQHATVNVLEERYGSSVMEGYATTEGFRIRGKIDPALVLDAAREGLLRLQRGDRALAIYRRCATALATCLMVLAGLLMIGLLASDAISPLNLSLVLLLSMLLAPRMSPWFQRFISTSMDVKGMSIGAVELLPPTRLWGLVLVEGVEFAVRTKPARRIYQPPMRFGDYSPVYVPSENQHQR